MNRVEEKDPELAEEIRKLMFVFEDLVFVDDKGIQALLKEVDQQKLVIALKTAPEEIKAPSYSKICPVERRRFFRRIWMLLGNKAI